jgi:hypothetical protein
MLEGDSVSFKIDHLSGVNITHWTKENKLGLIINRDGEIGSKFLNK